MGDIFTTTAIITDTEIRIERDARFAAYVDVVAIEERPDNLADADTMLAFHGFRRVRPWDLGAVSGLSAPVKMIDNQFNGVRAARLWQAVGTTHEEWEVLLASEVNNGDLISDMEISEPYVVAGSRRELEVMCVHMIREGGAWESRYTADFPVGQLVQVARLKK